MLNISKMIFKSDFFKNRQFITAPEYENTAPAVEARRQAQAAAEERIEEITEGSE